MAVSGKIGQLILLPLLFQILIAVSIAAEEYPFDKAYAKSLKNMEDHVNHPLLTFDGIYDIGNAEQPHTLKVAKAVWNYAFRTIKFTVIGKNKFYVEPSIESFVTSLIIKGRFSLETISIGFICKEKIEVVVELYNEDKRKLTFYGLLFTQSNDDGANIAKYAIVQDPITTSQIESLMETGSAEGTMEWIKALIEDPPSEEWLNSGFGVPNFFTKPMITTTEVTTKLLELIRKEKLNGSKS